MDKPKNDFLRPQQPCPICGGTEFEWGRPGGQVFYIPGDRWWTGKGRQAIRLRRCLQCNNLQQFTDLELTRRVESMTIAAVVIVAVVFVLVAFLTAGLYLL